MKKAKIVRKTSETDISLELVINGNGEADVNSGCGFLNHMLTLFAKHGRFDLRLVCRGDTDVDFHHSAEDIGICLGLAFKEALGDKKGICRYGYMILPMDEALVLSSVDFSGRSYLNFDVLMPTEKVGDFDTELVEEFWMAFCRNAECTLHIKELCGSNSHHIIEAVFKSAARSMRRACGTDADAENEIPSTKGVL